jgi:hypothetical protein
MFSTERPPIFSTERATKSARREHARERAILIDRSIDRPSRDRPPSRAGLSRPSIDVKNQS